MNPRTTHAGFTLIEIALVLIVFGIIAAVASPAIGTLHSNYMREGDRNVVATLKEALIGHLLATGAFPPCLDATGAPAAGGTGCDTARSLGMLGVRLNDMRNNPVRYDVSDTLTAGTTADLCARIDSAVAASLTATGPAPYQCDGQPDPDTAATWTTYCTAPGSVAFVLVGVGQNRPGSWGEIEHSTATRIGNENLNLAVAPATPDRIYENLARRAHGTYDDVMAVYTLAELRAAVACGVGSSATSGCGTGEKRLTVLNGHVSSRGIRVGGAGGSCYAVGAGNGVDLGCRVGTTTVSVLGNLSCAGTVYLADTSLSAADVNSDGIAQVNCPQSPTCTAQ